MRSSIRAASLIALPLSIAWLAYRPAIDSVVASILVLAIFLLTFLFEKISTKD